jgi:hypothetical protein
MENSIRRHELSEKGTDTDAASNLEHCAAEGWIRGRAVEKIVLLCVLVGAIPAMAEMWRLLRRH